MLKSYPEQSKKTTKEKATQVLNAPNSGNPNNEPKITAMLAKSVFQGLQGKPPFEEVCSYCKKLGHWEKDYLKLKRQLQG